MRIILNVLELETMPTNEHNNNESGIDRRGAERAPEKKFYSVQFAVKDLGYFYQFKIRDVSTLGLCILVDENSKVLKHLQVGDVLEMKYYLSESMGTTETFKTEIRHITKDADKRFKGHYQIGLELLDE